MWEDTIIARNKNIFNSRQLQDLIGHFPVAGAGPNVPVRIGNVMNPQLIMELRIGEECCYKNPFLEFSMMANSLGEIACKRCFHLSVCSLGKFEKCAYHDLQEVMMLEGRQRGTKMRKRTGFCASDGVCRFFEAVETTTTCQSFLLLTLLLFFSP